MSAAPSVQPPVTPPPFDEAYRPLSSSGETPSSLSSSREVPIPSSSTSSPPSINATEDLGSDGKPEAEKSSAVATEILFPDVIGLKNFYKVNDSLYRGGELTEQGIAFLKTLGVKTIISFTGNVSKEKVKDDTIEHILFDFDPDKVNSLAEVEQKIIEFLQLVNTKNPPIYFHCHHGVDRTGLMCAAYRVIVEGWSRPKALAEMQRFTSCNPSFFIFYKDCIWGLDPVQMRKAL